MSELKRYTTSNISDALPTQDYYIANRVDAYLEQHLPKWVSVSDDRIYMAHGIPTIELGSGGVIVGHAEWEGGVHGIYFSLGSGEVGELHPENYGKRVTDIDSILQIVTDNPDSIQVVINALEVAKQKLEDTPTPPTGEV